MKPFSLSTIQEERTSQMFSPEAASAQQTETLRQQSLEEDEQRSPEHSQHSLSVGKVDDVGDLSISIGNQELTLSLYQTPDLSEKDAKNICEMFADELAESITESKYVELPPLRFMKQTAKASNVNMEAIVIDIDQQGLEEYESLKAALENVDDLKTEADEVSIGDWNDEPGNVQEYEAVACEEIFDLNDETAGVANILTDTIKQQEIEQIDVKPEPLREESKVVLDA